MALGGRAEARRAVVPDDGQPALRGKLGDVALAAEAATTTTVARETRVKDAQMVVMKRGGMLT